tara:strand:+ start:615 stop:749 length:135 start_codon:yes stop_codon:yes gene_type:complete
MIKKMKEHLKKKRVWLTASIVAVAVTAWYMLPAVMGWWLAAPAV